MIKCDQCLGCSCTHCVLKRNVAPGCDKKFHGWLCPSCKCAKKEARKEMTKRHRVRGKFAKPEPSTSDSSRGSDGAADAQCPITDYGTDSGSSNKGEETECQNCCIVETESDSYGEESEFECDSEGNLPFKKAFCAECKGEGSYWVMFECHRCNRVFHPPCITPDGREAVVMDDRYDSYVCFGCEAQAQENKLNGNKKKAVQSNMKKNLGTLSLVAHVKSKGIHGTCLNALNVAVHITRPVLLQVGRRSKPVIQGLIITNARNA